MEKNKNKCDQKIEICLGKDRKHCEKWRKCWVPAFSPLPTISTGFFPRVVKSWDCVVKSEENFKEVLTALNCLSL